METVWKRLIPLILIALLVFLGVLAAFIWNGVERSQRERDQLTQEKEQRRANVLVTAADSGGALCAAMVISADPKKHTTDIISIPTDTLVDVAGSNQPLSAVPGIGGMDMLLEKLPDILPLPISNFLAFTPDTLAQAVDAAGGVEMELPYAVSSREPSVSLRRGEQRIDGTGMTAIFTYTGQGADAQRALQQEAVQAFLEQNIPLGAAHLQPLLSGIIAQAATDFSSYETADYAAVFAEMNIDTIGRHTLPGSRQTVDGERYFVYDVAQVNAFVNELLQ